MPQITYQANKVYIHHWPLDTPKWSNERKEQIDSEINKDKKNKEISISENGFIFDTNNCLFIINSIE